MTERWRGLDDDALGRALTATAREIEWPATPDVSGRVAETLHDQQRVPSLARAAPVAPPSTAQDAVGRGGRGAAGAGCRGREGRDRPRRAHDRHDPGSADRVAVGRRERSDARPSGDAAGRRTRSRLHRARARRLGFSRCGLGRRNSRRDQDRAGLEVEPRRFRRSTTSPGEPSSTSSTGTRRWRPSSCSRTGTRSQQVEVDGHDAWWITGPHELDLVTGEGTYARYRVTGNVLVWKSGDVVMRLETTLGPCSGDPGRPERSRLTGADRRGGNLIR